MLLIFFLAGTLRRQTKMKFRDLAEICLATYGLCKALDAFQEIGERKTRRNEMKRAKRTRRKEKQRPYERSMLG